MSDTFLGLPLAYWSIPCLVLASTWVIIWPSYRAEGAPPLRQLILRWGHAATWFCLALATFFAGTGLAGGSSTAAVLAIGAVVAYSAFLYTTITTVPVPKQEE